MRIETVALHHQVLTAWADYRRSLPEAPAVLSLDFHTDVMHCFRNEAPDPAPDAWREPESVRCAVSHLRHDEHFDWALRAGVISSAVIAALSPCAVLPEHEKLQVWRSPVLPEMDVMLNAPAVFRRVAAAVLDDEFLAPLLADRMPDAGFILDIDCDYFMCREALFPKRHALFDKLIKRAGLVTLSREDDWVKILKLPGEDISGGMLAQTLENVIHAVVAADR